jgi:hypothetical protein
MLKRSQTHLSAEPGDERNSSAGCPAPIINKFCQLIPFILIIVCLALVRPFSVPKVYSVTPLISTAKAAVIAPHGPEIDITATTTPKPYTQAQIDQFIAGSPYKDILRKLIKCESQNTNIARMDSNNLMSYGILQFNGTSTWAEFAPLAGVSSSPMNPSDAIKVADFMISRGFLGRWTCAHLLHLIN